MSDGSDVYEEDDEEEGEYEYEYEDDEDDRTVSPSCMMHLRVAVVTTCFVGLTDEEAATVR